MPRRDDIQSILVIGSGPIVIGQACEFDYSGTQACRVLAEEGYRVDPGQLEPGHDHDRPRHGRPHLRRAARPRGAGGHHREGAARRAAAHPRRPDRAQPDHAPGRARRARALRRRGDRRPARGDRDGRGPRPVQGGDGGHRPRGARARASPTRWTRPRRSPRRSASRSWCARASSSAARARASPRTRRSSRQLAAEGLAASPVGQILVEQSIAGWKEFELEVMRDGADNCVVVCSIENFDPMGVHTGDSITVAPAQTLTDVEYQAMRDDAFACLRRVGVETGGSNVQFAVDPATGRRVIIEMNPRVSRSSALASKATGFPDRQDRGPPRRRLPARRDPQRHHPGDAGLLRADHRLRRDQGAALGLREACRAPTAGSGTRMQSVGEVMAIGRTFCESLQKALRSLEQGRAGLNADPAEAALDALPTTSCWTGSPWPRPSASSRSRRRCAAASASTRWWPAPASTRGSSARSAASSTERPTHRGRAARSAGPTAGGPSGSGSPTPSWPTCAARPRPTMPGGAAGRRRAGHVQDGRHLRGRVRGVHARTTTPPTRRRTRSAPRTAPASIILGSGPNRIGQGIEFDYCCVARVHDACATPATRR